MITLHLKFPGEPTALSALDGMAERGVTIDSIGEMSKTTGWHVNLRGYTDEDRAALADYIVEPVNPIRVFA